MKMINAWTHEIDEIDDAIAEIEGLLEGKLASNTVGIVTCHPDYIANGIVAKLAEKLPFPIAGLTTNLSAAVGEINPELLHLAALTAEDASFAAESTVDLNVENYEEEIRNMVQRAKERLGETPKFGLIFSPVLPDLGVDALLDALDEETGGIPLFGSVMAGFRSDFTDGRVITGSGASRSSLAVIFITGNIEPRYYLHSIANKNVRPQKAIVTESDGYFVKSVNDMPFFDYLRSVGFDVKTQADWSNLPVLFDFNNSDRAVALGVYAVGEGGSVQFARKIPEGTTFSIGVVDPESIMTTGGAMVKDLTQGDAPNAFFIAPCVTRYFMLAPNSLEEAKYIVDAIGNQAPYALFYSGGEICPVTKKEGVLSNQLHNYSIIALAL
ncbi:hypothetical protein AGMMS49983_12330 [Clostridia bacterium]|nr:hypothetical protein AGMMS49983_12330 [Clostridia bacterium]